MERLVEIEQVCPHVALLTLNRPSKRNALNRALMQALIQAVHAMEKQEGQRVIIFQGAKQTFCAGLDLEEAKDESMTHESAAFFAEVLKAIYHTPLVTIAAVQGVALAGGGGITAACDITVAEKSALFGFPEVKRGLVAALVSVLLKETLSKKHLNELLLIGEMISSDQAYRMGLVNRVVDDKKVLEESMTLAKQILKGAPSATSQTKRMIQENHTLEFDAEIVKALAVHKNMRTSFEAKEGIKAFIENRPPTWTMT